jgi:thiosulfate/3-mercaptopyruvate sulfurtransferase
MKIHRKSEMRKIAAAAGVCGLLAFGIGFAFLGAPRLAAGRSVAGHPITAQQDAPPARPNQGAPPNRPTSMIVDPVDLAKEIAGGNKPIVVCVGVKVLFEGAHVPGAIYHGPASTEEGLDDLKKWAKSVPKDANIVLYCGCCPLTQCPNARPALMAMRQMGFTKVRGLKLTTDFKTDWIDKGYPVEKGK